MRVLRRVNVCRLESKEDFCLSGKFMYAEREVTLSLSLSPSLFLVCARARACVCACVRACVCDRERERRYLYNKLLCPKSTDRAEYTTIYQALG